MAKEKFSPKVASQITELYETQSIHEAAFCLCSGLKLHSMDRRDGSRVTFAFEGKEASRIADGFFNGAKVEARKFSDALRSLKDRVFKR